MELILEWAGPVIYTALGLAALYGIFTVVLLIRKVAEKRFANNAAAEEFLDQVRERLAQKDFEGAAAICDSPPYWAKAVPQMIMVAIAERDRPMNKLRQLLAETFEREVLADLEYRFSWIGTIIKSAPMLGLLGTVCGMILAFAKIAGSSSTGVDPATLADDISFALFTTALGLSVAIPLTLLGAAVRVRMGKLQDSVQQYLSEFLDDLEVARNA
jgi:biopolymer transport protein ExbB